MLDTTEFANKPEVWAERLKSLKTKFMFFMVAFSKLLNSPSLDFANVSVIGSSWSLNNEPLKTPEVEIINLSPDKLREIFINLPSKVVPLLILFKKS